MKPSIFSLLLSFSFGAHSINNVKIELCRFHYIFYLALPSFMSCTIKIQHKLTFFVLNVFYIQNYSILEKKNTILNPCKLFMMRYNHTRKCFLSKGKPKKVPPPLVRPP